MTFSDALYSAFLSLSLSFILPSLKINLLEDAVILVGFISITLSIQVSLVW